MRVCLPADDYAPPGAKSKWLAAFYLCIPVGYALVSALRTAFLHINASVTSEQWST